VEEESGGSEDEDAIVGVRWRLLRGLGVRLWLGCLGHLSVVVLRY
jgi:hypothetical protein